MFMYNNIESYFKIKKTVTDVWSLRESAYLENREEDIFSIRKNGKKYIANIYTIYKRPMDNKSHAMKIKFRLYEDTNPNVRFVENRGPIYNNMWHGCYFYYIKNFYKDIYPELEASDIERIIARYCILNYDKLIISEEFKNSNLYIQEELDLLL